jgi:hypothetical protein
MNALLTFFLIAYGIYALLYNITFWIIYIIIVGVYLYLTQFTLQSTTINSIRRKVSIATWGEATDPQTYLKVKLDITKMEEYLEEQSKLLGEKITITVYVIKLMSIVLKKYPELNGYIKFGKVTSIITISYFRRKM